MSFYPSNEYDSSEIEAKAAFRANRHLRQWLTRRGRDDDDDDPPPMPAAARRPEPPMPLVDAAAEAA
jgi:hypothetical protein